MAIEDLSEADECADNVPEVELTSIKTWYDALRLAKRLMPDQGMQVTDNFADAIYWRAASARRAKEDPTK